MPAMGVEHAGDAIFATPDNQIAAEVAQGLDLAGRKLRGQQGGEPAVGEGNVKIALGRRRAARRCTAIIFKTNGFM